MNSELRLDFFLGNGQPLGVSEQASDENNGGTARMVVSGVSEEAEARGRKAGGGG